MPAKSDLEQFNQIMKNYAQATLIFKQRSEDREEKLKAFIAEIEEVFRYIDHLDRKKDLLFKPESLMNAYILVADADPRELEILRFYGNLLINRLNSYTRNKRLIYKILVVFFMQFLRCLQDHSKNQIMMENLIILSAIGLQTSASQSFIEFIQGPLQQAIWEKKSELERGMNNEKKSLWKKNALK